jgi:hypothetical protein
VTSAKRSATAGAPVVDSQQGVGAVVVPAATASTRGDAEAGEESWVHAQLDACARLRRGAARDRERRRVRGRPGLCGEPAQGSLLHCRWLHVQEDGSIDPGAHASWGASGSDDLDLHET